MFALMPANPTKHLTPMGPLELFLRPGTSFLKEEAMESLPTATSNAQAFGSTRALSKMMRCVNGVSARDAYEVVERDVRTISNDSPNFHVDGVPVSDIEVKDVSFVLYLGQDCSSSITVMYDDVFYADFSEEGVCKVHSVSEARKIKLSFR
jgi:hypothetical protein